MVHCFRHIGQSNPEYYAFVGIDIIDASSDDCQSTATRTYNGLTSDLRLGVLCPILRFETPMKWRTSTRVVATII